MESLQETSLSRALCDHTIHSHSPIPPTSNYNTINQFEARITVTKYSNISQLEKLSHNTGVTQASPDMTHPSTIPTTLPLLTLTSLLQTGQEFLLSANHPPTHYPWNLCPHLSLASLSPSLTPAKQTVHCTLSFLHLDTTPISMSHLSRSILSSNIDSYCQGIIYLFKKGKCYFI